MNLKDSLLEMQTSFNAKMSEQEILPGSSLVNYQPPAGLELQWIDSGHRHWSAKESYTAIKEIAPLLPPRFDHSIYKTDGVIARVNESDAGQINLRVRGGSQLNKTRDSIELVKPYSMYRVIYPEDTLSAASADDILHRLSNDVRRSGPGSLCPWQPLFGAGVYAQYRVLAPDPEEIEPVPDPRDAISYAIESLRDYMHDERADAWVGAFLLIFTEDDGGYAEPAEVFVAPQDVRRGSFIESNVQAS